MIEQYLTSERYLRHYNEGEKTVVAQLNGTDNLYVVERQEEPDLYYDNNPIKVLCPDSHYLVGPIVNTLHAYEELGYSPDELKKIIEEHKKFKARLLYVSTATSAAYGAFNTPFGKKCQEMREELERRKRFHEYLEDDVECLYPLMIFKTNALNKNKTTIKERVMENKNFTKADLKVGYVVKMRGDKLYMVMPARDGELVFVSQDEWFNEFDQYDEHLLRKDRVNASRDVVEVYGYSKYRFKVMRISTENRPLLWKREEKTCDQCIHKVVCSHVGMCEHFAEKK